MEEVGKIFLEKMSGTYHMSLKLTLTVRTEIVANVVLAIYYTVEMVFRCTWTLILHVN